MLLALLLGAGLAFVGTAPMTGPLALLVLDRIIAGQRAAAFWIGLAGALVEGLFAGVIGTFLPLVLRHSSTIVRVARLSGAIVIFGVGLALALRPGLLTRVPTEHKSQSFAAGFLATALNPTLLATWTVAVTALYESGWLEGGYAVGASFGAGVAAGALGWFALLLVVAKRLRPKGASQHRGHVARGLGIFLLVLGAALFIRVLARGA